MLTLTGPGQDSDLVSLLWQGDTTKALGKEVMAAQWLLGSSSFSENTLCHYKVIKAWNDDLKLTSSWLLQRTDMVLGLDTKFWGNVQKAKAHPEKKVGWLTHLHMDNLRNEAAIDFASNSTEPWGQSNWDEYRKPAAKRIAFEHWNTKSW